MAIINNPQLTNELASILNASDTIDTTLITSAINRFLPSEQQLAQGVGVTTGVYKRFGQFDKIDARVEVVTAGLWTGDAGSLTTFFTSSVQNTASSSNYYINVYKDNPQSDSTAEVQFAIAYGHINGSGSQTLTVNDNSTLASKATYSQYRSILLDPTDDKFTFGANGDSDDIYVINFSRARYREKLDPQNWTLKLSGSNGFFTFIDDSGKKFDDEAGTAGRVFNVVSGSLNLGTQDDATIVNSTNIVGLFYPDKGFIVLNPSASAAIVGSELEPNLSTSTEQRNHIRLYNSTSASGDFEVRRTENISTQHFFARATNREFNFSNNPTFSNQSTGRFLVPTFTSDPKVYITTVGLYNDSNELIAVAKTSQPIPKSFDRELLIKIKIDF
jgi:hypothetical protein